MSLVGSERLFSFLLNFVFIFFCGGGYRGGRWIWEDWEMGGMQVHAVKFPKNRFLKLIF